ncbi:mitochondrial inner membrane protein Mitofilin [Lasiosphaeria ovina]|uniref:MICOS complex subunit MIC60 n=1 Tax=Lasiosphaeria ovina TaxID=92902 RepID=A0AAE0NIR1_9PEZI|nr:mitochondrial inner membrane protein Mitofilin [Lasiosphaeria ovina]
MLRTSLRSVRALGSGPAAASAGRQWHVAVRLSPAQRYYASGKKPVAPDVKPIVLPSSETLTSPSTPAPPLVEKIAEVAPENAPLEPPAPGPPVPPIDTVETAASAVPPPRKGFFRRLRNYLLTLALLGALGFGGGVWYSRVNDNFHDFFTEYVPYGEQAVLYFEDMDFRKRFPNVANRMPGRPRDAGEQVRIPAQSGASWRVADGVEPGSRQSSAVQKTAAAAKEVVAAAKSAVKPEDAKPEGPAPVVVEAEQATAALPKVESKEFAEKPAAAKPSPAAPAAPAAPAKTSPAVPAAAAPAFQAPEVDEPSRWPPASPIDPLAVSDAAEPVVQDLVRMLNDIITVVNHDGANERYGATIGKAKNELAKVGRKIKAVRAGAEQEAAKKLRARADNFDKAANKLVSRIEAAMAAQETQWRREFEAEMERVRRSYDEKVKLVQERERQITRQKLDNTLLEQAIALQRQFAGDVEQHVERERGGRLGRLQELAGAVADLEKLATGWSDVVDANLRTQQLHVAADAVRASLEDAAHPRPFTKELAALKEIAAGDAVVDAAIASIHPSAYQRGVSTAGELVDRFRRVAAEVRKASLLPEDAGVASHASSYVLSKLLFRKRGLAAGDDVESILTRTQTCLEEGDLDKAAREMNGLTGWAKTLSRDWLGEVRKVLEVQQALEVIQTEARLQSLKVE